MVILTKISADHASQNSQRFAKRKKRWLCGCSICYFLTKATQKKEITLIRFPYPRPQNAAAYPKDQRRTGTGAVLARMQCKSIALVTQYVWRCLLHGCIFCIVALVHGGDDGVGAVLFFQVFFFFFERRIVRVCVCVCEMCPRPNHKLIMNKKYPDQTTQEPAFFCFLFAAFHCQRAVSFIFSATASMGH